MANTGYQLQDNAARLYEQGIVPTMSKPLTEMLFEHMPLQAGDRVLDIACGTGIAARVAVQRFHNLACMVGVDLNSGMLDVAREAMPETPIPIQWHQADAGNLPLTDHQFDVILCQHGLQFMPDKLKALREMKRVLAPGGRLALIVWGDPTPYQASLAEALARYVSEAASTSSLAPFSLRDAAAIKKLLDDGAFRVIEMKKLLLMRRLPACVLDFAAQQPYARDVEQAPEDVRAAIDRDVQAALTSYAINDGVYILPQESHLVLAQ
jgi:ubiquinone/menaquinone biosynthesis C-methylase UbiE